MTENICEQEIIQTYASRQNLTDQPLIWLISWLICQLNLKLNCLLMEVVLYKMEKESQGMQWWIMRKS
jgi:hypothetical protein